MSGVSGDRTPVLVGAAQWVERDVDLGRALEPLAALERVARGAAEDAELKPSSLAELDAVAIPNIILWSPQNGPRLLAEKLGARPSRELTCGIGGETPVSLINELAQQIACGRSKMALVATSHLFRTRKKAGQAGVDLDWTLGGDGRPEMLVETLPGCSELEIQYGLAPPATVYPIFENALRARRGLDLETHRRRMGELFSRFTEVAARNPYAWFAKARSPEELTTVTAQNRMVAFPYPKFVNAVMETDQAAALLVMSAARARALGVPESRWVYWLGGAGADEQAWFPVERPDLAACPALRASAHAALDRAGVSLEEIDRIDFYSCFPAAVSMACEMLGLAEDDPRGFTVTGGLPYAGGPGNGYNLHAVASMVNELRAGRGTRGLVTGNGWHLTKHAALVLSSVASTSPVVAEAGQVEQDPSDGIPRVPVSPVVAAEGRATVETYTVVFGRDGAPERGIVIGRLASGERFLADTPTDATLLEDIVSREMVGAGGRVSRVNDRNRFDPA